MTDINPQYLQKYSSEEKVRDFIAGMTDDFFLKQASLHGAGKKMMQTSLSAQLPEPKSLTQRQYH